MHRVVAARHLPALDVLGAYGQLHDFGGVRLVAGEHVTHALGIEQLFRPAFVEVGVDGVGGIEQRPGLGKERLRPLVCWSDEVHAFRGKLN